MYESLSDSTVLLLFISCLQPPYNSFYLYIVSFQLIKYIFFLPPVSIAMPPRHQRLHTKDTKTHFGCCGVSHWQLRYSCKLPSAFLSLFWKPSRLGEKKTLQVYVHYSVFALMDVVCFQCLEVIFACQEHKDTKKCRVVVLYFSTYRLNIDPSI